MPSISTSRRTNQAAGEFGVGSSLSAACVGFAVALAFGSTSTAQEPAPKRAAGSSPARPSSDSLRFANGLLRQKKFELAAQEYERILKAGRDGSGA